MRRCRLFVTRRNNEAIHYKNVCKGEKKKSEMPILMTIVEVNQFIRQDSLYFHFQLNFEFRISNFKSKFQLKSKQVTQHIADKNLYKNSQANISITDSCVKKSWQGHHGNSFL